MPMFLVRRLAMCLRTSNVVTSYAPNWEGDSIEQSPVIKAARCIPGSTERYPIDIREFLSTTSNAVVRSAVEEAVDLLDTDVERSLFWSHKPGSFDLRTRA